MKRGEICYWKDDLFIYGILPARAIRYLKSNSKFYHKFHKIVNSPFRRGVLSKLKGIDRLLAKYGIARVRMLTDTEIGRLKKGGEMPPGALLCKKG